MKKLNIEIVTNEYDDKIATGIKTFGYSDESISDQFQLIGLIENVKTLIQERIKKLMAVKK